MNIVQAAADQKIKSAAARAWQAARAKTLSGQVVHIPGTTRPASAHPAAKRGSIGDMEAVLGRATFFAPHAHAQAAHQMGTSARPWTPRTYAGSLDATVERPSSARMHETAKEAAKRRDRALNSFWG